MLKTGRAMVEHSVRFNQEADSLNFSMLGPDAAARDRGVRSLHQGSRARDDGEGRAEVHGDPSHDRAGGDGRGDVIAALKKRLDGVTIGDPSTDGVRMGPLAGRTQVTEVRQNLEQLREAAEVVYGGFETLKVVGADPEKGAFFPTRAALRRSTARADRAAQRRSVRPGEHGHAVCNSLDEAIALANLGAGPWSGRCSRRTHACARTVTLGDGAISRAPHDRRPHRAPRSRLATGHRCRIWCTAGRAARAAVRKWAGCAACCTTCSAPRCRARRPCIAAITKEWIPKAAEHQRPHPSVQEVLR